MILFYQVFCGIFAVLHLGWGCDYLEIFAAAVPNYLLAAVEYRHGTDFVCVVRFLPGYSVFVDSFCPAFDVCLSHFLHH